MIKQGVVRLGSTPAADGEGVSVKMACGEAVSEDGDFDDAKVKKLLAEAEQPPQLQAPVDD